MRLALLLFALVSSSAVFAPPESCLQHLLAPGNARYLQQAALADLALLHAEELELSRGNQNSLRSFLQVAGLPSSAQGQRWYQKVGRAGRTFAIDLLWTQLPFAWRGALDGERFSFGWDVLSYLARRSSPSFASVIGVDGAEVTRIVGNRYDDYGAWQRRSLTRRLYQVARSAVLSVGLTVAGLHPAIGLSQRLFTGNAERGYERDGLGLHTLLAHGREHENFAFHGKKIVYLVEKRTYDEFHDSSEWRFFRAPMNAKMRAEAQSVELRSYGTPDEFVALVNGAQDTDILVIESHGFVDETGDVGGFQIGDQRLGAVLPRIEDRPLRPGGALLFVVCYAGSAKAKPPSKDDEMWIRLARKKLPTDGKAFASTVALWGDGVRSVEREGAITLGVNAAQAAIGPGMLFFTSRLGDRSPRFAAPEVFYYPKGFRVYDRASDSVRRYETNNHGGLLRVVEE